MSRLLELEPEDVLDIAANEYGVESVDDANFKRMVSYVAQSYTVPELRQLASDVRLRISARDTKRGVVRKLLIRLLDEGMSFVAPRHRPGQFVPDFERLYY